MNTNNTTQPVPPLTVETITKLLSAMPKVNVPRYCVTTPEYAKRLFGEAISKPQDGLASINVIKHDLGSIQVIEKPGQRAAAWFISSEIILRAYLQGWVTEKDLEQLQAMK